jgi:hypothetical protein
VRLRFWRVFELNMIGQYFSAFLIGTTGGDFVKIFYVARAVPQRKAAVALTVMADRVIGLVALLLFGAALALPNLPLLLSTDTTRAATGMFFLFAAGGVAVAIGGTLAPLFLGRPAIRALLGRLPQAERVGNLVTAYECLARAWRVNLVALAVSLPSHVCSTLLGYCVLRAMHLRPEPPLLVFCAIIVIVNMLISLPVSISGVGLREQLFVFFFALVGIDGDHAVTFSITCFFLSILWSLAGGPFYFLYRHETHTPAPAAEGVGPLLSETR